MTKKSAGNASTPMITASIVRPCETAKAKPITSSTNVANPGDGFRFVPAPHRWLTAQASFRNTRAGEGPAPLATVSPKSSRSARGNMKHMAPLSDEELAKAFAAAVENYAAGRTRTPRAPLDPVQATLDRLLYHRGGDGILELSVSQPRPKYQTLLGIVIWVETQTLGPVEAEFHLDQDGSVKRFTVRAGDGRVSREDAPAYPLGSWRKRLRFLEGRPTVDEDWEHVLRYQFD